MSSRYEDVSVTSSEFSRIKAKERMLYNLRLSIVCMIGFIAVSIFLFRHYPNILFVFVPLSCVLAGCCRPVAEDGDKSEQFLDQDNA